MPIACEICGARLDIPTRGRSPRFCSDRCRQKACRARKQTKLPQRLRKLPRWTAAKGKRPMTTDGRPASSTDPLTWTSYSNVKDKPHGIMLGGGIACIDLDQCLNHRGEIADWAREIIEAVPKAVIEKSLSETGLHIFGLLPETPGKRKGCAEIYSRQRFIRTTENIYRTGELIDLAPAITTIDRLHKAGKIPKRKTKLVTLQSSQLPK